MYSVNELQPYLQPTLGLIAVTIPALGELQKNLDTASGCVKVFYISGRKASGPQSGLFNRDNGYVI